MASNGLIAATSLEILYILLGLHVFVIYGRNWSETKDNPQEAKPTSRK